MCEELGSLFVRPETKRRGGAEELSPPSKHVEHAILVVTTSIPRYPVHIRVYPDARTICYAR